MKFDPIFYNGETYTRSSVAGWTREQMRPLAKHIALQRNDGVNRTLLWNAAAELQRDYVFEGILPGVSEPLAGNNGNGEGDSLEEILARRLYGKIGGSAADLEKRFNELEEKLREELINPVPKPITVIFKAGEDSEPSDLGIQHKQFPLLMKLIGIKAGGKRHNIALIGPTGTGKTRSAHEVAKALGLKFYPISVGPQTTQSHLTGFMDAKGEYVRTALREGYENGGVVVLDEFDAANAGVATITNALTANEGCGWPDGNYVKRHEDCIILVCMNTYGNGADRQYVGRNQLDAATMARFAFVSWDQDDALEMAIAGNKDWCAYVQRVRRAITGPEGSAPVVSHIVSPRVSYEGSEALEAGIDRESVEEMYLWKGLKKTEKAKVLSRL